MYDVIIIGKGPAGISASLYTLRANLKTLIIGKAESELRKAGKIENYYGFREMISGEELFKSGEVQALRLGAEILDDEVIALEKSDFFHVVTQKEKYTSRSVILATGQKGKKLAVEGLSVFEGNGVSYCTTCDGFFFKNLSVGVLGYKDYAVHEAIELKAFTQDITIYTNGNELDLTEKYIHRADSFKRNKKPIERVSGTDFLEKIHFTDGTTASADGLFIAYGSATSADFARKLGVLIENNSIITDRFQQTNLEGLFAAGDCTGGFKQIATAVGQGAMAGRKAIEYVRDILQEKGQDYNDGKAV